ncbi:unnamed protein product (macronuclear) [Paramecium tetraurelia]|uniref:Uncharacterized protein n=1 Tax=Paramecium tetraurelia TaxID=5888 RepID=A0BV36_PARTE|nr:uncharacterized protein GSPATT00005649001 [Paramecium tetraurelia]CAK62403.1 unnamed protein product [Paramecium tetraurelia]|eukprot:XP_001429801.1 hypothetical protein (macronuclear) [Paramecium tetraurelia strain d4-2]
MSNVPNSQHPPQAPQQGAPYQPNHFQPGFAPQYAPAPVAYGPPLTSSPLRYSQPLYQPSVVAQPVYAPQVVQQPVLCSTSCLTTSCHSIFVAQPVVAAQPIKGESRIEYVPYEKTVLEYEEVRQKIQVPRERYVTDYYAVEYQTEYVPQVFQEKFTEYVPVDRYQERVEYYPVERQVVHQQVQPVVQQPVQVVQQPVSLSNNQSNMFNNQSSNNLWFNQSQSRLFVHQFMLQDHYLQAKLYHQDYPLKLKPNLPVNHKHNKNNHNNNRNQRAFWTDYSTEIDMDYFIKINISNQILNFLDSSIHLKISPFNKIILQ